ncbi:putative kinase-like protein TMKL1 [Magnolia sinica]|uniref:putative kinase-like protein TMKL1 n=1 Tax=Magnolia sinica TaxID=86752 RepID=UPI00265AB1A0|nr:putative kinase-like protein TMKL1 [Magnolia sinica]
MERSVRISIVLGLVSAFLLLLLFIVLFVYFRRRKAVGKESGELWRFRHSEESETEDLIAFPGGENLTIHDILDAPGEVVGKSSYGTLYKASLQRSGSVVLLRFLRPTCTGRMKEILPSIQMLGFVRHPNLVPMQAFYSGARGEKLLVYPFFERGTLSRFLGDGSSESHRWPIIYCISLGIANGLDHLHTGLQKPIIHGNLKSKNILLNSNYQPYLSDFGLRLLLNPTTGQEILEASALEGYKAPELIKMKDASKESDIYSLGVILLEILTGKESVHAYSSSPLDQLPNLMRNAILHHRVTDMFNPQLLSRSDGGKSITGEGLLMYFQLAMSCCSPSPALRPDTKQIIRKLEEIGQ